MTLLITNLYHKLLINLNESLLSTTFSIHNTVLESNIFLGFKFNTSVTDDMLVHMYN